MNHTVSKPQITAIDNCDVSDVSISYRCAAASVVIVHRAAIYCVRGVDILIIVSCDIQAVAPTATAVVVQAVIPEDVARRRCYEYAALPDCVVDGTVCDIDISGCQREADAIVIIVSDGAARDCYVVLSSDI